MRKKKEKTIPPGYQKLGRMSLDELNKNRTRALAIQRDALDLCRGVGLRLKAWMRREGRAWETNAEFISAYRSHLTVAQRILAEWRAVEKQLGETEMTDAEIRQTFAEVVRETLEVMPEEEFVTLCKTRVELGLAKDSARH